MAVRNEQLAEIAAPLLKRDYIPRQVTVYAAQRASTYAPQGNALLIYPEGETVVSAVTENGKVSLTRTLEGVTPQQLQMELPQLALSAELQGINASFPNVLLDESCYELRDTVQGILASPTEIVGVETPPASVKLNLLPESWRLRRSQLARRGEWRKWLIWAGAAYAGLLFLFLAGVAYLHLEIGRLDRQIARDAPKTEFVRAAEANWKALAPADRFALLPGRNFAAPIQQSALARGAHYCLQPVRAPNLSGWRSRFGGARLSVYRQIKKESGTASFSVRHGGAAHSAEQPCPVSPGGKTAMMMPAWYERMNQRERLLSWIVAGAVICIAQPFDLELAVRCARSGAGAVGRAQSHSRRASCLCKRAWSLGEARSLAAASTNRY